MRTAIEIAESIFEEVARFARPGITERQVSEFMLAAAERYRVGPAWEQPCPIVNSGPDSMIGHGVPGDIALAPGHVLHIDFGVKYQGYCSDLQRCWYVPHPHEQQPPADVQVAFDTLVKAMRQAGDQVRPGVRGWELDAIARRTVVEAGYPAYDHALGHQVGRCAHDGGALLGPRWARYGDTPEKSLEAGNVFTLEPSIGAVGHSGCIGLEEMILVTEYGCQWLSQPQTRLPCLAWQSGR
jgi:Xaa-Pro aminopeptidase